MDRLACPRVLLCLAVLLAGCPRPIEPTSDPADASPASGRLADALRIPPSDVEVTATLLAALAARAEKGDLEAAWQRVHYLLDLFDDARFARDNASLALLHRVLALPDSPARGPAATQRIADHLDGAVDRILARDPGHAQARAARSILAFDRAPPTRRSQVLGVLGPLEQVARSSRTLTANAELRLLGYCSRALADAVTARYAERIERISHCLYPLYDANPEPYFAENPERRPPPPDWQVLAVELDTRLARVFDKDTRVSRAAAYQRRVLAELIRKNHAAMPSLPATADLPLFEGARPYDWTPLVSLVDRAPAPGDDVREALTKAVAGDGRLTLTAAIPASASAQTVLDAARLALGIGAARLELAGVMHVALDPPPGDYWHGRLRAGKAETLAVVPLALAPLAAQGSPAERSPAPPPARPSDWDASRATLGLHLVVAATRWQLVGATGMVAEIPASPPDQAAGQLAARLGDVRAAFPDEDALVLVPGDGATAGDLARAALASTRDPGGRVLLRQLGLTARAPVPRTPRAAVALADRIARRKGARVTIEPSELAIRASVLRACYQGLLERNPRAGGRFRLELEKRGAAKTVTVTSGPADRVLRACVLDGLAATMKDRDMASAAITLDPS